jgi:hypothetical protein
MENSPTKIKYKGNYHGNKLSEALKRVSMAQKYLKHLKSSKRKVQSGKFHFHQKRATVQNKGFIQIHNSNKDPNLRYQNSKISKLASDNDWRAWIFFNEKNGRKSN